MPPRRSVRRGRRRGCAVRRHPRALRRTRGRPGRRAPDGSPPRCSRRSARCRSVPPLAALAAMRKATSQLGSSCSAMVRLALTRSRSSPILPQRGQAGVELGCDVEQSRGPFGDHDALAGQLRTAGAASQQDDAGLCLDRAHPGRDGLLAHPDLRGCRVDAARARHREQHLDRAQTPARARSAAWADRSRQLQPRLVDRQQPTHLLAARPRPERGGSRHTGPSPSPSPEKRSGAAPCPPSPPGADSR